MRICCIKICPVGKLIAPPDGNPVSVAIRQTGIPERVNCRSLVELKPRPKAEALVQTISCADICGPSIPISFRDDGVRSSIAKLYPELIERTPVEPLKSRTYR